MMNELDKMQQLFVITMEECGELIQQCSKCLRQPNDTHGSQEYRLEDNKKKLLKEVGDVYAMIELMVNHGVVSWAGIFNRAYRKKEKLKQWSDLIE